MKMKICYWTGIFIAGLLVFSVNSCNYLDVVPDNVEDLSYAFRDKKAAEGFLSTCYSYLPAPANLDNDPAFLGSDEFFSLKGVITSAAIDRTLTGLITGLQGSDKPLANYWDGDKGGKSLYNAIRDCNIFLERIDEAYDLGPTDKARWVAEVQMLKAYYHFYLIRMYGAIVIVDKNLPISASSEEMQSYRAPFDECVDYVRLLINGCIEDLPLQIERATTEQGRMTRPVALAVKAKLMVMAASPLFNGNPDYTGLVDNRGKLLYNPEYQKVKWDSAVVACRAAIDCAKEAGAELYNSYPSSFLLNDTLKLQLMLRQVIFDKWNSEMIWGSANTDQFQLQTASMPKLLSAWASTWQVKSALNPTFELVELYYTDNGVPMEEDLNYDSENLYKIRTAVKKERWYIKEGYKTVQMHFNREPRFYASIGFDGGIWWGNGKTNTNEPLYATEAKALQVAGKKGAVAYSVTGYFAKKLVNYETTVGDAAQDASLTAQVRPFPIIRLADLYLLYAESLNEASEGYNSEVFTYVDDIRRRAGLKGVVESWANYSKYGAPKTKEEARKIIQRERMIELAAEGHHFWDLRRWKLGVEYCNNPVRGWNISGETVEDYYNQIVVEPRSFRVKDYLFPIRESNLIVNPNLIQNYGW